MRIYNVPGAVLSASYTLSYLFIPPTLGEMYYYPSFTGEESDHRKII